MEIVNHLIHENKKNQVQFPTEKPQKFKDNPIIKKYYKAIQAHNDSEIETELKKQLYCRVDYYKTKYNDMLFLEDKFRERYNRELNGKNLGQFHIDFDLDCGLKDEKGDKIKCKNIYSEKFIGLGKKSYIDSLVGTCPITGNTIRGFHIRMKGIPNGSILYYCRENNITPLELYQKLEKGDDVELVELEVL